MRLLFPLAVAGALVVCTRAAPASPLLDPHLGGVVFTGPTAAHPTAVYFNPAAMALDSGTHLYVASTLRLDQLGIDRAAIDPDTGVPGGSRTFPGTSVLVVSPGGFVSFVSDFNNRKFTFGVAASAPIAQRLPAGRDELGYHVLDGHDYELFATLAMSYRVNERLMVGFGVHAVAYSSFQLSFLRDTALEGGTAGLAGVGAENPEAAERYDVAVSSILSNLSFNAGIVVQPKPGWLIGLAFTAPPGGSREFEVVSEGTARVTAAPRDGGAVHTGSARVAYKLPFIVALEGRGPIAPGYDAVVGVRWEALGRQETWDLRLFGGDLGDGGFPEWYPRYRGLNDVWVLEAGVEAREHERVRPGVRVRVATPAVSGSLTAPAQFQGLELGALSGVELRLNQGLAVALGYALTWSPPRDVTDSAFDPAVRIACADAGYPLDDCAAVREGRAIPTAAGAYHRLQHGMSLALRYDWL